MIAQFSSARPDRLRPATDRPRRARSVGVLRCVALLAAALLAFVGALPAVRAQSSASDAKYAEDYQRRLLTVDAMRGALQREAASSGKPVDEVIATVDKARQAAHALAARADYRGALQALDGGYAVLRDALTRLKAGQSPVLPSGSAALTAPPAAGAAGVQARAEQRLRSARALREALLRFDATGNATLGADAERALAQAERLYAAGDHAGALAAAEAAYAAIREASVAQRDHTEQVASKAFATPREEYAYERARNDDYARLARGVAEREEVARLAQAALDKGLALRGEAEREATGERWAEGVRLLEASTLEYKKVVRAAGFNVP